MSSVFQADLVVSRLKQMIAESARALHVKPEVMADYEDWSRKTMKVTSVTFACDTCIQNIFVGVLLVARIFNLKTNVFKRWGVTDSYQPKGENIWRDWPNGKTIQNKSQNTHFQNDGA